MTAIAAKVRESTARERRASPRRRVCLEAQAQLSAGQPTPVVIHDLSQLGFVMETAEPASIGTRMRLRLLNCEPVAAQLVWNCGSHFGCEFERPLSSAMVNAALLKSRPVTASETLPRRIHFDPPGAKAAAMAGAASVAASGLALALAVSTLLWATAGVFIF